MAGKKVWGSLLFLSLQLWMVTVGMSPMAAPKVPLKFRVPDLQTTKSKRPPHASVPRLCILDLASVAQA